MNRPCRIVGCASPPRARRGICRKHEKRIARYGDPHFTQWSVADDFDVDLIVRERRPAEDLTRLERVMVARGLHGQLPGTEIARIVGVTPRTVWRWAADGWKQAA